MRPTSGLTFGGRYQLSSRVAIGGMGEVWQATDLVIGRTIAIKILKDEYLGDPGFLERFRAEARHAALVNHEGIANVFDYGEEEGSAYLVMELVPGEALSTILERERVLSTDRVLDIVAQTASALHAAHSAGLVHRDIKPGNLLITPDGRVKITDFGIARIADQVPLTATGQVMGTVQYLSPEQASGHPASPTTDIYSLGIVAYESLAGRRPFTGESQVAIAMAQINEAPPELPVTTSEPVRNLVYACIAKNPADRPASAAHLARAAQALRRGDVVAAASAVPGVLGAGSLPALQRTNPATQPTRLLTTLTDLPAENQPLPDKGRSPWTWPLIAIAAILLVALVGLLVSLVTGPTPGPTKAPTTPAFTPTPTPTPTQPTPTPTSDIVKIDSTMFIGDKLADVQSQLQQLGLGANMVPDASPAPDTSRVGTAYFVNPTGNVRKNDTITVRFYGNVPAVASQPAPLSQKGATSGNVATVNIPAYSGCPSGSTLLGFLFTVSAPSSFTPNNPVPPNQTTISWSLAPYSPTQPTQNTVSYVAQCSTGSSPSSATLTIASSVPLPAP